MRNLTMRALLIISILFFHQISAQISDTKISCLNGNVKKKIELHYDILRIDESEFKLNDTLDYSFKTISFYNDNGNLDSTVDYLPFSQDCILVGRKIYKRFGPNNINIIDYLSLYYPKAKVNIPTDTFIDSVNFLSKRKYRIISSNQKTKSKTVTTIWLDKQHRKHKSKTTRYSSNKIYSRVYEKTKHSKSNPQRVLTSKELESKLRMRFEWNVINVDSFNNPIETIGIKTDYNQKIFKKIILTTFEYR